MTNLHYVPDGWPVLIPRIVVDQPESLVNFVKHVFGAAGSFNRERPTELRLGESILMIGGATDRPPARVSLRLCRRHGPHLPPRARQRGHLHRGTPRYALRRSPGNGSGTLGAIPGKSRPTAAALLPSSVLINISSPPRKRGSRNCATALSSTY